MCCGFMPWMNGCFVTKTFDRVFMRTPLFLFLFPHFSVALAAQVCSPDFVGMFGSFAPNKARRVRRRETAMGFNDSVTRPFVVLDLPACSIPRPAAGAMP